MRWTSTGKSVTPMEPMSFIDFIPLYKVRKNFDDNIKESIEYVR